MTEAVAEENLVFTRAAAHKVRELMLEEGNSELKLRVYIQGGGCSGFQYGFSFDEQSAEDDLAIETDGVTLVCPKDRAQEIKQMVLALRKNGGYDSLL